MIYNKLLQLQKRTITLKKDAKNPFFKSYYITLDNILSIYNDILTELKIVCYHYTCDNKLRTVLLDTEDDTRVESEFNIYNQDPQKQGSEITYWKRYNLWQLLNIQTDKDDDWNKASKWWNTKQFYPKLDVMDYITRLKDETDVNVLDSIYKEFKAENPSEKQEAWFVKEAKIRKEYLLNK